MLKSEFKVAFCFNMKPDEYQSDDHSIYAEWDSRETIDAVSQSLTELGFQVYPINFDEDIIKNLKEIKPDFIFNIAEGFRGDDREAQAVSIYEMLGIPYTGSGPLGHAIALNKEVTKRMVESYGIKTAPFHVFYLPDFNSKHYNFSYPAIVKPIHEGSSIGIDNNAYVENFEEMKNRVIYILNEFKQPAIVEQFIQGREFNQAVIGNKNPILFPIVEIDYSKLPDNIRKFSSFEVKTVLDDSSHSLCPANLTHEQEKIISDAVLTTYRACNARDFARIDLMLDKDNNVYILELNSIPGIAPGKIENHSMPKAVKTYGWDYTQMIGAIMEAAFERYNISFEDKVTGQIAIQV